MKFGRAFYLKPCEHGYYYVCRVCGTVKNVTKKPKLADKE